MQPIATTTSVRALASAPRGYLFTSSRSSLRTLSTSAALRSDSRPPSSPFPFGGPSPPKLPKEDQEIFESLQRASTGAFSTPRRTPPRINQSPHSAPAEAADAQGTVQARVEKLQAQQPNKGGKDDAGHSNSMSQFKEQYDRVIEARGRGEELHPDVARGARPEFEGDVNPKTGEVGGPKNEPLRWGASGEWSYNGRTTDF
ncbi:hypothetical protein PV05_11265 [Exophiala xenobiotica]|uniref:Succinate dehydrogenase assembly factor 4, mitochondrial n=1 Tax=Exophiala xenobiotica TaxID=348802 RepID=A0A0D2CIC6_9EURO|nr:uncharacterized protein PV05_11265 [Exophiala xenobiotica]KIW49597.1 hypothetical protein PV05_11265 [Exophiala xenobiotica]